MGLVSPAGVLAQVAASLFSGHLIDRLDRRRTMIACDLGRAVAYGLLPALAWLGRDASLALIFATVILGGALSNVFSVGYMTAIPSLVGP